MNNTYSHQTVFDHITKSNLSSVAKSNPDLYARYVEMEKELAAELKKLNFSDNVRGNHKSIILPKIGDDFFPIILVGDDEVEEISENPLDVISFVPDEQPYADKGVFYVHFQTSYDPSYVICAENGQWDQFSDPSDLPSLTEVLGDAMNWIEDTQKDFSLIDNGILNDIKRVLKMNT